MILNNQRLEQLKKQYEEVQKAYELEEEATKKYYDEGEQALAKTVNAMFQNQPFKFSARLTDDKQHIELWATRSNILVGKYTRLPNKLFQNVEGTLTGLLRDEEILLSKMKEAIFKTMENCFK